MRKIIFCATAVFFLQILINLYLYKNISLKNEKNWAFRMENFLMKEMTWYEELNKGNIEELKKIMVCNFVIESKELDHYYASHDLLKTHKNPTSLSSVRSRKLKIMESDFGAKPCE